VVSEAQELQTVGCGDFFPIRGRQAENNP